jgi:putative ABC transport system permease protein
LRLALLRLRSSAAVIATLAVGIGVVTMTYAIFSTVLFGPVPGTDGSSDVVSISFESQTRTMIGYGRRAALDEFRREGKASGLESLATHDDEPVAITVGSSSAERRTASFVSSEFFATLDVRARIGRLLTDAESDADADAVVISEAAWRSLYSGAPDVVGRSIRVDGHPFTIVGVTDVFRGWNRARSGEIDAWLPLGARRRLLGRADNSLDGAIGRMRPGADSGELERHLQAAYGRIAVNLPARDAQFTPFVVPGLAPLNSQGRQVLLLYRLCLGAAGLVLLLACVNGALLSLAGAARREREVVVRLALGATQARVTADAAVDAAMTSLLSGALGILIAWWLAHAFTGYRLGFALPNLAGIVIDRRVLAMCLLASTVTTCAFGLAPVLAAARVDIRGVLVVGAAESTRRRRLRSGLMAAEIAVSVTLVAAALILHRSVTNLTTTPLGIDVDRVLSLSLAPDDFGTPGAEARGQMLRVKQALVGAGFKTALSYPDPLVGWSSATGIRIDPAAGMTRQFVNQLSVSPEFFEVTGVHLLAGRTFTAAESSEGDGVMPMPVVVSAGLARDLFGGTGQAMGRRFDVERYIGMATESSSALVIGVAADTRTASIRAGERRAMYLTRQSTARYGALLVRADNTDDVRARIRAIAASTLPAVPITNLRPLSSELVEELSDDAAIARVSAVLAIVAGLLAASGVVALVMQVVAERRRSLAVRVALGATRARLLVHLLRDLAPPIVTGSLVGIGLYAVSSRWLSARMFGVSALDPAWIALTVGVVTALAVAAACLGARQLWRFDPWETLRQE